MMRKTLVLWIGLLIFVSACLPESEYASSPLDRNATVVAQATVNQRQTFEAIGTLQALPTQTPSVVQSAITTTRLNTPTPTIAYDYVLSSHTPGAWQTAFFTHGEGTRQTLEAYTGELVLIQTFSTVCQPCAEQTGEIRAAIENLNTSGNQLHGTFLMLSIDPADLPEDVAAYQAASQPVLIDGQTWQTGVASVDLIRSIRDTFGDTLVDPYRGGLILMDKDGLGHVIAINLMDYRQIRDVLQYFDNYGTEEES